jgi:DNA-binding transcriptional ArsR family regulator
MVRASRSAQIESIYLAIQEPTRRALLDLLAEGECSVVRLAEPFAMSRPAISQHLKVLKDAGLVRSRREGRQNLYRLDAAPLELVFDWLSHYQQFWTARLEAL